MNPYELPLLFVLGQPLESPQAVPRIERYIFHLYNTESHCFPHTNTVKERDCELVSLADRLLAYLSVWLIYETVVC